jgi:hypothetical protein
MRRYIVLLLVAALSLSMLAVAAEAKKKKRKPLVTFEAEGSTVLPNPTDLMEVGVTRAEFEQSCAVPTASQGLDGYVIELPRKVSRVTTRVSVTGTSPTGVGLYDLFFFDKSCSFLTQILGSDDFDPLMPRGTAFVLVTNWLGDPSTFRFNATEVR